MNNIDELTCQRYLEGLLAHVKQYSTHNDNAFRNHIQTMFNDPSIHNVFTSRIPWNTRGLCIAAGNINALKVYLEYFNDEVIWFTLFYKCRWFSVLEYFDSLEILFRHPPYLTYFLGEFPKENYVALERMNPQITQIIDKIRGEAGMPPYDIIEETDVEVGFPEFWAYVQRQNSQN